MKIALIQSPLVWENPTANRNYFEEKINALSEKTALIVLPEMFTTGFTMRPETVAETMQGKTISWLIDLAKSKKTAITGSLVITEKGAFYNRLVFVFPSGKMEYYDKKHLFSLAGESCFYTAGNQKLIVNYLGWKICPLICYDLRFPVFSRNCEDYELLIYVANWPEKRIQAWDALLKARAIENMCYAVGVNRTGIDANNFWYNGHSQVQDFMGNAMISPQESEGVFITDLDKNALLESRQVLGFLKDRDVFEMR